MTGLIEKLAYAIARGLMRAWLDFRLEHKNEIVALDADLDMDALARAGRRLREWAEGRPGPGDEPGEGGP